MVYLDSHIPTSVSHGPARGGSSPEHKTRAVEVHFLYCAGCPSNDVTLNRLRQVVAEEGIEAEIEIIKVETEEQAQRLRFTGSPTILINGRDIDPPPPNAHYALTCRAYRLEGGHISPLPSPDMIRRALRAAAEK